MFDGDIQLAAVPADHSRAAAKLGDRLGALADLDYGELRTEWRRLYRAHPPKKMSRDLLELGVAWKLQEKALGGLGASVRRRLADLAQTNGDPGRPRQSPRRDAQAGRQARATVAWRDARNRGAGGWLPLAG
jgi:hypothetical protein